MDDLLVCVCTYNEESNIQKCIRSIRDNGIDNILIVDASTDRTRELALAEGVKVVSCDKGLSIQRQKGIDICEDEYLAFVDADDRIEKGCLHKLLEELKKNNYAAICAQGRVYNPHTYWEKAIDATWKYSMFKVGESNMVGRPAVYLASAIKEVGADTSFSGGGAEDIAISIRIEKAGYKQGIGSGITYRECPSTFIENYRAWVRYGKEDAKVINRYPQKRKKLIFHNGIEYPFIRSCELVKNGGLAKIIYCPYPIMIGLVRLFTMLLYSLRRD